MKLSIIVPVYNRYNITNSCLRDLSHLPKEDCEIIIVDDASSDETKSMLTNRKDIIYIRKNINEGFGKSVNVGYAIASGRAITILNNDIKILSDHSTWYKTILNSLDDNCLIGPTGGYVDPVTFDFIYETNDYNKKINYISGWCISATSNTWAKLSDNNNNIFDPDYHMYFEDTSLSFKANSLGINLKLINLPLFHFGKVSSKQKDISKLYLDSKKIFMSKWKNAT
jgi:GT2 family glycosyltransferase